NAVDDAEAEELQWYPESRVVTEVLRFEVDRRQHGIRTPRITDVRATDDGEELMDAAVRRAVRSFREAHFLNGPELLDERRHVIRRALPVWNEVEHRVFRPAVRARRILRVRDYEPSRSAECRLVVADRALIPVEPCTQTGGIGMRDEVSL